MYHCISVHCKFIFTEKGTKTQRAALLTGQQGLVLRPEVFPLHLSAVGLGSSLIPWVISVSQ